jgi:dephospho-CoA kinase
VIIDADIAARAVVELGTPGLARVAEAFGADVLGPDGALDRDRLGAIVFRDPASRATLNAIVHPLVAEWMRAAEQAAVDAARGDLIIVHDVPLLAENRRAGGFDLVIVVDVPPELQLERLVGQRGLTPDQASARDRQLRLPAGPRPPRRRGLDRAHPPTASSAAVTGRRRREGQAHAARRGR